MKTSFKCPIEPTPILKGEDARRLLDSVINFKRDPKKARFLMECVEVARAMKIVLPPMAGNSDKL